LLLSRKRDSLRPFHLEDDLVFFRKPLCFHAEQHENRAIFADVFCDFFRKIKAQHDFWPDTSYSSLDRPAVLRVADELSRRGCSCFLDRWYLQPGQNWVEALEKALAGSRAAAFFIGPREMGRWQQKERAWVLDRHAEAAEFHVVPVLLPGCEPPLGFLKQLMWIDLRERLDAAEQLDALAAAIRGQDTQAKGGKQSRAAVSPYRGLLPFREEDASFFFGREKYVEELVGTVTHHRLVAVVGASGSGKTAR
jgi:hypothetical protein